jgi:hypothetical protein
MNLLVDRQSDRRSIEARSLVAALRAADASVLIKINNLPAGPLCHSLELTPLVLSGLLLTRR